jgi:cytochrome c556
MRLAATFLCATMGLLAGCGGSSPEPSEVAAPSQPSALATPASVADSRQIMLGLVIPAADVVWGVGSENPADDAAWEKVAASAVMIAEGARLMTTGSRVVDQMDWMIYSQAMADAATLAARAAGEKSVDGVSEAGNALYESCDNCHRKYMTARAGQ